MFDRVKTGTFIIEISFLISLNIDHLNIVQI